MSGACSGNIPRAGSRVGATRTSAHYAQSTRPRPARWVWHRIESPRPNRLGETPSATEKGLQAPYKKKRRRRGQDGFGG